MSQVVMSVFFKLKKFYSLNLEARHWQPDTFELHDVEYLDDV